ncbi:NAD(P)-dependent oxidoreductase [Amycolatopsis sp. PS_44_ISF1]|uniref:NAD-dependent epimerase/dehydratase family protein n=1 Tax=Amycolatopsis sp. PS_44_ISF1 TaxID=2974917 RepID=UPI0028DFF77D|nr:NAD(P)-dependent oxidoreductase [Amycolatopsis sp. PS_44_ISF1]MDT8914942.1 NAD(P)-dependent oxidoreductase [Amycolatopsis sp. PS_44_ISF1]
MKILITGALGKVGRATVTAARRAGHDVVASDQAPPSYGPADPGEAPYVRADLTDHGQTVALVTQVGPDAVVHAAGIPEPFQDTEVTVFDTNVPMLFHVIEAVRSAGVPRLVWTSSETATGYLTGDPVLLPDYLPVDEDHPLRPREGYALSKVLGEHMLDALVRRQDNPTSITAVSIRPSLVTTAEMYDGFIKRTREADVEPSFNQWTFVDADDLGDLMVRAATATTPGHEVVYAAQPDNLMGRPLADLVEQAYGSDAPPIRHLERPDAGAIDIGKARRLFGWEPRTGLAAR